MFGKRQGLENVFEFSERSMNNLMSCDIRLIRLFKMVIQFYDCSVLCGFRDQTEQNKAYHAGKSQLRFPDSKHNILRSLAVDVVPYPIDWDNIHRFYHFAGFVKAQALMLGLNIRWGGDWDGDTKFDDQKFHDLPHFEIFEIEVEIDKAG